jgi:hypothetical protein
MTRSPAQSRLIRRCKWHVARTGFIAVYDRRGDCWIEIDSFVNRLLEDMLPMTDGICRDCLNIEKLKLQKQKEQNEC